jgi:SAM-dependent methyltransferase
LLAEDGERFLPWMKDPVINYEHLHRYLAVREFARGGRVLDMASGEGYGSRLLAEVASAVVGVDVDHEAVRHATQTHPGSRVRFLQGSITALPLPSRRFDLVVCYEALEHLADQEALCAEAARVLAPGGLFVVSTPNRVEYTEAVGYQNPFHVKELDLSEFTALLGKYFGWTQIYGQRVSPVSALFPLDEPVTRAREYLIAREAGAATFHRVGPSSRLPRYYIAVAAVDGKHGDGRSLDSYLVDASEQLFEVQRRAEGAVVELTRQLKVREDQVLALERQVRAWLAVVGGLRRTARTMGLGKARRLLASLAGAGRARLGRTVSLVRPKSPGDG